MAFSYVLATLLLDNICYDGYYGYDDIHMPKGHFDIAPLTGKEKNCFFIHLSNTPPRGFICLVRFAVGSYDDIHMPRV